MDRASLDPLSRGRLIEIILNQTKVIAGLLQRVGDIEAKAGLPPKTPDNLSVPPSQGRKASGEEPRPKCKRRRKAHAGSWRAPDPDPTRTIELKASRGPHCQAGRAGGAAKAVRGL
jgi:transposase